MSINSQADLFIHTLKDVLYAERQMLKALPKMERRASDAKLKKAFALHREETETQINRLDDVFAMLGKPARGAKCDAIIGLIDEAEGLMSDIEDAATMDAALIAVAQAIEHYEIARYRTLVAWAGEMAMPDAAAALQLTLDEETATDAALTKLAMAKSPATVDA